MQPKPMPTGFSVSSRISPSIARGSGREEFEILCRRAVDCLERDRGIESGQAAFVRDLKLEQINVRELPMTLNVIPSKASGFAHTHRVRPENMLTIRAEGPRARGRIFGRRAAAGRGRGLDNARISAFSVSGQVAHLPVRLRPNHAIAAS